MQNLQCALPCSVLLHMGKPVRRSDTNTCVLLQSGPTAPAQVDQVGNIDVSKLTAVSFAAMRLEIGSWQVLFEIGLRLPPATCSACLLLMVPELRLICEAQMQCSAVDNQR